MARHKSNSKNPHFDAFLISNEIPIPYERTPKKFTTHDMYGIRPKTNNQQRLFDVWADGYNISVTGFAGTGKSFVSIYLALNEILNGNSAADRLIIVRSAVSVREVGYLPGTLEEKTEIYELPYKQIFDNIFKKKNQYRFMKEVGLVEFQTTSFVRGLTFDNAIVIFDEAQNATMEELSTVITRMGVNSRLIISGDTKQNDLIRKKTDISGFPEFLQILNLMPSFRNVHFTMDDIVRGDIVKEFLVAESRISEM